MYVSLMGNVLHGRLMDSTRSFESPLSYRMSGA